MTLGAWRRWGSPPAAGAMGDATRDTARGLWLDLTGWLRDRYGLDGEPAWMGEDTGWVLRFRRGGRALTTLSPRADGTFGVLVVIGPSIEAAARAAPLSAGTAEALASATSYADGRWLWLNITGSELVEDVKTLLALKSPPPARRRTGPATEKPAAGSAP